MVASFAIQYNCCQKYQWPMSGRNTCKGSLPTSITSKCWVRCAAWHALTLHRLSKCALQQCPWECHRMPDNYWETHHHKHHMEGFDAVGFAKPNNPSVHVHEQTTYWYSTDGRSDCLGVVGSFNQKWLPIRWLYPTSILGFKPLNSAAFFDHFMVCLLLEIHWAHEKLNGEIMSSGRGTDWFDNTKMIPPVTMSLGTRPQNTLLRRQKLRLQPFAT